MAYRKGGLGSGSLHDPELLAAALVGYEQQRSEIVQKISDIQRQLGGRSGNIRADEVVLPTNGRRRMSAAARKRIAAAQKKRWAAYRKAEKPAGVKKTAAVHKAAARPMRKMSAAARKRIAEAQRKRWAEARAQKTGQAAPKAKAAEA